MIVVTTNDLPGHRIVRVIGLVRGITVRSRSIIGSRCSPASPRPPGRKPST